MSVGEYTPQVAKRWEKISETEEVFFLFFLKKNCCYYYKMHIIPCLHHPKHLLGIDVLMVL